MESGAVRFLEFLVRLITGAKRILEIGAFIGVLAMTMARAMPVGGKITAIEKFDRTRTVRWSFYCGAV